MKFELYKNKKSEMPLFMVDLRMAAEKKKFFTIGRLYAGYIGLMADYGGVELTVWIANWEDKPVMAD